ncbi:MAG TPA: glycerol dehydrogenase [Casimicrobiaceae bacterium]|nr:glycerol dehydrogenase [Casimicrobiaceae bacterium]
MIIFGSPARYVQGRGVLEQIGTELARLGNSAVLVIDPAVRAFLGDIFERSCAAASVTLRTIDFGGEATPDEIDRLERELGGAKPAVVVAAGGGKCIDIGKALGGRLGTRIATVPTAASNDAPTSHVYVLYDRDHRLLRVEKLARNPDLVIVDVDVIARAPEHLLVAGIGDALVKKYEVEQCVRNAGRNVFGSSPSMAALFLARGCYDVLRADTSAALAAVRARTANDALERIVEACVLMSGLSFESGGLCIAHAMTRGLSAVQPVANALHGYQVAYGVTVQLVLERRSDAFLADHAAYCTEAGLPLSLAAMGLPQASSDQLRTIAELTLAVPHLDNFDRPVAREEFIGAMQRVEQSYAALA